ncbi:MAG: VOC family protein [Haloarculaceae archaeon]
MTGGTLPASAGIGRIGLTVETIDETVAFYRDVVGLTVHARDAEAATLGTPDEALLELRAEPDCPPRPGTAAGLFHTAFRVPTRGALADALDRVREEWELSGASDHLVSEALYLRDPEGNGVEIYRDRDRSEWPTTDEGRVAMVTDPLDLAALASEATGTGTVPVGSDVGHVHLEVTDLPTARRFYADALGMNVRQEMSGALFLAAGEYHHHVGCNVWNGRSTPAKGRGLDWFEVVVPADAVGGVRERVETAGFETGGAEGGGGPGGRGHAEVEPTDHDGFAVSDADGVELRVRPAREV